jgi:hypothetical protein
VAGGVVVFPAENRHLHRSRLDTPQVPKEKPECWIRQRAFEQVRHGSNIQLLSFSLVSPSDLTSFWRTGDMDFIQA